MPLTEKGAEIKKAMTKEYGPKKGESVFYASANAGKIKGVHRDGTPSAMEVSADFDRPSGIIKGPKSIFGGQF